MRRALPAWVLVGLSILAFTACGDNKTAEPSTSVDDKLAVKVEELGEGDQAAGMKLGFKGPLQVNFRRITIPPGAGTGKHCHDGNLIAVVDQGTLTHYAPIYASGVHTYNKGDSIFEGSGYIREGKNEGDEDVVLMVTYVTPEGDPLAETDLKHCESGPSS
jgi:quercetin dioxygenase-like cupin family protein